MTVPIERDPALSRRAALAKARQSRRPSRLGQRAGTAGKPDYPLPEDAGFPTLLKRAWRQATAAPDLATAVDALLTLAGHVPADVQLRALPVEDECALKVLVGRSWRDAGRADERAGERADVAFLGEIGLNTSGRLVVRVPAKGPLSRTERLVGGVLRVPWSAADLAAYRAELARADARRRDSVADCRRWLAAAGADGRRALLEDLTEAALRTAPFILYAGDRQYTNFRDPNTLTGKTLWPGHPDCALSSLTEVPPELWADDDALMVVCLMLLVRSGGYARIEEANGTQLSLDHVAHLLERTRLRYNAVVAEDPVPPAASTRVEDLLRLAEAVAERRREVLRRAQLYREIHGPLLHKVERVAGPVGREARRREAELCARLRGRLPIAGDTLAELTAALEASPEWLAEPHGEFGTGLESVVYEVVRAAQAAFEADFAMSRGMRSLPALIAALREEAFATIVGWEIPHFFCCVVPAPQARRFFGDSAAHLADVSWAISSRMQYNSWHFVAGNLPKTPEVAARDHFVPPAVPDLAHHSDQHHNGHVAAKVRFTIRSPQPVRILDRAFQGFVDLRLLRCEGPPFDEQDLLATHRASAFVARATTLAAELVARGATIEVTSFDPRWHWEKIAG
ncbi:hypothetical protein [Thermomonospora catenispora]|uniref:hypothetical protein n=1 Tax=Thermomonospora catenispora TaxID=2493090 RepID=UPI001122478D|nr:hypothetical protein [Thermomonospora catenispora]TNY36144.1 hypothetical protein EIO00_14790 [Thermomonospora catenispora]